MSPLIQSLYVLGDIGYFGSHLKSLVYNFKYSTMLDNSKIILLGDNFYPDGINSKYDEQWCNYEKTFQDIPYQNIYGIMGNHDYHGNPLHQIQSKYFANNDLYYKTTFQNLDLYFLDTVLLYKGHCSIHQDKIDELFQREHKDLKNQQLLWLEKGLKSTQQSNRRSIVFGHYPILTNGLYTNQMKPMYNTLMPLFEKYKVDAYISGHEHNIQYIERKISDDYKFHQFISGTSSEFRTNEYRNEKHVDMYENDDYYYLQIYQINGNIFFEFKNKYGIVKHCYVL